MLFFLDLILSAIHLSVIGFNLFGWIKPKWRKAHLVVVAVTIFSWLVLGLWYGFGYCFLTDIQWDIKRQLGETQLPNSFITYLANNIMGLGISPTTADVIVVATFIPAVLISIVLNVKRQKK